MDSAFKNLLHRRRRPSKELRPLASSQRGDGGAARLRKETTLTVKEIAARVVLGTSPEIIIIG
jgi:hypothetical protein